MSQPTPPAKTATATKKRSHSMRFGATVKDNGTVLFRLWAPSAKSVQLLLTDGSSETAHDMESIEGGWFTTTVKAAAGMKYKFKNDEGLSFPDPASRCQPDDVHGASQIIDPTAFQWSDTNWQGKAWEETVLYELHVGTFTPEGTFAGVASKLDYLKDLGVTAIELMPVADFPGKYGWGYDGVLPYAPESDYGTPDDLKALVQQAHQKGLQVFLDVVYNHFGPEGNYLHAYAKEFFTDRHKTPWGAALNFEGRSEVREFFIENALYWLEEYNFDGLRLDAVHAIKDDSKSHILDELVKRVASGLGRERARHLVLENDDNIARFLKRDSAGKPELYSAQWNDDIHHAYHVIATGEGGGYYADYVKNEHGKNAVALLGRALAEGFIYQNDSSAYRDGERRGEKSAHLPPSAFVSFIQNHDQIGNRAFGDRIASIAQPAMLDAITSILLLAPSIPLLYMGEEWASKTPFMYFCDLGPELAPLVTEGRRGEFAKFPEFSNPETRDKIPDPCTPSTFENSKLNWADIDQAEFQKHLDLTKSLLHLRQQRIVPLMSKITSGKAELDGEVLVVQWFADTKPILALAANLTELAQKTKDTKVVGSNKFTTVHSSTKISAQDLSQGLLPPYSVLWMVEK